MNFWKVVSVLGLVVCSSNQAMNSNNCYVVGKLLKNCGGQFLSDDEPEIGQLVLKKNSENAFLVARFDKMTNGSFYHLTTLINEDGKALGGSVVRKDMLYKLPSEYQ